MSTKRVKTGAEPPVGILLTQDCQNYMLQFLQIGERMIMRRISKYWRTAAVQPSSWVRGHVEFKNFVQLQWAGENGCVPASVQVVHTKPLLTLEPVEQWPLAWASRLESFQLTSTATQPRVILPPPSYSALRVLRLPLLAVIDSRRLPPKLETLIGGQFTYKHLALPLTLTDLQCGFYDLEGKHVLPNLKTYSRPGGNLPQMECQSLTEADLGTSSTSIDCFVDFVAPRLEVLRLPHLYGEGRQLAWVFIQRSFPALRRISIEIYHDTLVEDTPRIAEAIKGMANLTFCLLDCAEDENYEGRAKEMAEQVAPAGWTIQGVMFPATVDYKLCEPRTLIYRYDDPNLCLHCRGDSRHCPCCADCGENPCVCECANCGDSPCTCDDDDEDD